MTPVNAFTKDPKYDLLVFDEMTYETPENRFDCHLL